MGKVFTLEEAQALLERVEPLLQAAVDAKAEAERVDREIQKTVGAISLAGGMEIDPARFAERKASKNRAIQQAKESLQEIQQLGVLVKDLDSGLIDFPALRGGEEVYLCWKLGEDRIKWWHRIEDGFAGRKPIDGDFDLPSDPISGSSRPN